MSEKRASGTIHNIRLDKHFTMLSNRTPEDPNLSWAAKGLLWYLLSRDPDWSIHVWQLVEIYQGPKGKVGGRAAIQELLVELRKNGYVQYTKSRTAEGKWHHRYDVYPVKIEVFQKMFPEVVIPALVKPALVNRPIIPSNELPSNELTNISKSSSSEENRCLPDDPNEIDDACGADDDLEKDESFEQIVYTKTNGERVTLPQKEIYRYFLNKDFPTKVIQEAIRRFRDISGPINNALKYLESTCRSIKTEMKSNKAVKKENKPIPPRTEKIPEKTITFEEYYKCRNLPNPFRLAKS